MAIIAWHKYSQFLQYCCKSQIKIKTLWHPSFYFWMYWGTAWGIKCVTVQIQTVWTVCTELPAVGSCIFTHFANMLSSLKLATTSLLQTTLIWFGWWVIIMMMIKTKKSKNISQRFGLIFKYMIISHKLQYTYLYMAIYFLNYGVLNRQGVTSCVS